MNVFDIILTVFLIIYLVKIARIGDRILISIQLNLSIVFGRAFKPMELVTLGVPFALMSASIIYWWTEWGANEFWFYVHPPAMFLAFIFMAIEEYRFRTNHKGKVLPTPPERLASFIMQEVKKEKEEENKDKE